MSEEYKIKDEEYNPEDIKPTPTAKVSSGMPGKKVFIIIGIIAVLFVVYQFVAPKRTKTASKPAPVATTTADNTVVSAQINTLSQQNNANSAKIATLENSLTTMQQNMGKINQGINAVNVTMQLLAQQVEHLKEGMAPKIIHYGKGHRRVGERYYIRAIVSGRAWLETASGLTLTVRPGSVLRGYGKVVAIDPNKGEVATSSGYVMTYGINDI